MQFILTQKWQFTATTVVFCVSITREYLNTRELLNICGSPPRGMHEPGNSSVTSREVFCFFFNNSYNVIDKRWTISILLLQHYKYHLISVNNLLQMLLNCVLSLFISLVKPGVEAICVTSAGCARTRRIHNLRTQIHSKLNNGVQSEVTSETSSYWQKIRKSYRPVCRMEIKDSYCQHI